MAEKVVERLVQWTLDAKDSSAAAFESMRRNVLGLQSSFDSLVGRVQSLGDTLGIISFVGKMNEVAAFRAKLDDLSDAGLGSVEMLSKLSQATRLSGGDFDLVTAALGKMVKNTVDGSEAMRRLGIDTRDSSKALKAPADLMDEVAKKFALYKDGADKAAFAQAIFGKGGERLLPLLKDMAEYGDLVAKVTTRQANEADAYEKALVRMRIALEGNTKKIAGEMIPAATALMQTITQLATQTKAAAGTLDAMVKSGELQDWAARGIAGLSFIVDAFDGFWRVAKLSGEWMAFLAAQMTEFGRAALGSLQIAMGPAFWKEGLANLKQAAVNLAANKEAFKDVTSSILEAELAGTKLQKRFEENYRVVKLLNAAMAGEFGDQVSRKYAKVLEKPTLPSLNLKGGATEATEYQKMLERVTKATAAFEAEAANANITLTHSEKVLAELAASSAWATLSDKQKATITAESMRGAAAERRIAIDREWLRQQEEVQRMMDEHEKTAQLAIKTIGDQAASIVEETRQTGLLESTKQALILTRKEDTLAVLVAQGASEEMLTTLREEIKARRNLVEAYRGKEIADAAREDGKAWADFAKSVEDVGAHAFETLFDKGRDGWKSLLDDMWSWFKRLVAQMLAQQIVVPIVMQAVGGSMGSSVAGNVGGSIAGNLATSMLGGYATSTAAAAGVGTWFGAGTAGASGIPLASAGTWMTALTEGAASLMSTMAAEIAALSATGIGIIAAAVLAIAYAFRDEGENWKARIGFGSRANAYANTDAWGVRYGFENIAGDDKVNRAIQEALKGFDKLDERIIKALTDAQNAAVKTALEATISTREYAFPKGDETAAGQLVMQYMKDHFGAVFSAIPGLEELAEKIKAFEGSIEDLSKMVTEGIGIIELVASNTIAGLTIPILKEWQKENESLAQTAARVVQNFATFVDKFAPESFKLDLLVRPFTNAVADLGVTLPATREGFFDYIQSLKLGDEAQRKIYDEIMNNYLPAADAYYSAIEKQAEAQRQAADAIRGALDSVLTDAERAGQAQSLLAGLGISNREQLIAWIAAIDPATEAGQRATGMLRNVTSAFELVYGTVERLIVRTNGIVTGVRGETATGSMPDSLVDQVKPVIEDIGDTIRDAFQTFLDYVERAKSQQEALIGRYSAGGSIDVATANITRLTGEIANFGLVVPQSADEFRDWVTGVAAGLDATTPRGIALLGLLTQLADNFDILHDKTKTMLNSIGDAPLNTKRQDIITFLDSLRTPDELNSSALANIGNYGLSASSSFETVRDKLEELGAQGRLTADDLKKIYDDWKRLHDMAPVTGIGTAPGGDRANAITAILDGLMTDVEKRTRAQWTLSSAGLGAGATRADIANKITEMALQNKSIESMRELVAAYEMLEQAEKQRRDSITATIDSLKTDAERLLSQQLTLASYGLANVSRDEFMARLDQMLEDGTSAETVTKIADAWKGVEAAATQAADEARAKLARIADFREGIAGTIAGVLKGRPGYDYGAYLAGGVTRANSALASAIGVDAQLAAAGKLRDALTSQYQFQMDALREQQSLAADNARKQSESMRELGGAFQQIGDYAKSLVTGDLSALSPEAKLAAAKDDYAKLLAAANGGDAKAAGRLSGAADTYLNLAKSYYGAGSGYAEIFAGVSGDLQGFGARGDAMMAAAETTADAAQQLANVLTPEMIALQDDYIDQLEAIDTRAQAWEAEQREKLRIAEEQRVRMTTATEDTATNTRNTITAVDRLGVHLQALETVFSRFGELQVGALEDGNEQRGEQISQAQRTQVRYDIAAAQV